MYFLDNSSSILATHPNLSADRQARLPSSGSDMGAFSEPALKIFTKNCYPKIHKAVFPRRED